MMTSSIESSDIVMEHSSKKSSAFFSIVGHLLVNL
jgi:hypothetical protein